MDSITTDTFINGHIQVKQERKGYRFSIDSVLLAYHAAPKPDDVVLDLGTGCGIIPLILAYRHPDIRIFGVETQKKLADIAATNVADNNLEERLRILHKDMRQLTHHMVSGPVDMVISNPPYRKANSGRINPDTQRAIARHEIKITLNELVQTAGKMLRTGGKLLIIYPAERMTDLITMMRENHIEPKMLRMIHSNPQSEAKLILVEGMKQVRPGITIPSPLIVYNGGRYTEEVEKMFLP